MKTLATLFTFLLFIGTSANAVTDINVGTDRANNFVGGYNNSFIFMEGGIEFSVFRDGQFDFFIPNRGSNINFRANRNNVEFSFNTGFNYNPFVQFDDFGAIVQIENTPIFYDYYGRVRQIGNININYNGFGQIIRLGGLNVFYRNQAFSHYTGFINIYNRAYVFRPWHNYYVVPRAQFCLINNRPYRRFYTPVRHTYYRPYINNIRQPVRINSRRGAVVNSRSNATIHNRYRQKAKPLSNRRNARVGNERSSRRNAISVPKRSARRTTTTVNKRSNNNVSKARTAANTRRGYSSNRVTKSSVGDDRRTNTAKRKGRVAKANTRSVAPKQNSLRKPASTNYRKSNRSTNSRSKSIRPAESNRKNRSYSRASNSKQSRGTRSARARSRS